MKHLLTLAICLLFIASMAHSQRRTNRDTRTILRVRLTDGAPFSMVIDGRNYERSASSLTVGDLPAGRHSIEVYTTTSDNRRRSRTRAVYQGTLRLGENTFNAVTIDAGSGSVDIQSERMDDQRPVPSSGNGNNRPVGGQNGPAATSSFNSAQLETLHQNVEAKTTDMDKLSTIKSAAGNQRISTAQVAQMLAWLSFDASRMDLAKWMYDKVIDRGNYAQLETSFSFDGSKEEFTNFLRSKN